MPERAALYVDGFNFYHAIQELQEPHLKWVNLQALGRLIIPRADSLVKVVYCTAYYPKRPDKKWRHEQYINAHRALGVECVEGHYILEPRQCNSCGATWNHPTEKQGDINVAIHLINDAWQGIYDHAYLLSADSDQAATAKIFRTQFPGKSLTSVSPPRRKHSANVLQHTSKTISLTRDHIAKCLLGPAVLAQNGKHGRRPREYDPPQGWQPPP